MFQALSDGFKNALNKIRFQDDEKALDRALDELKKTLLKNDVHHKVARELLKKVESQTKLSGIGKQQFLDALEKSLLEILRAKGSSGFTFAQTPPTVVLMAGLQGSGKTTTTAKLAHYLKTKNKKVLLCACDLQRLAAVEQLKVLGEQVGVEVFYEENKSVKEIANNALKRAKEAQFDVLLVDSAGRLAIDKELMQELKEVKEILNPHEVLYVADALSGQDGVKSANTFNEEIGVSGVVLSKFDSDSKGGIALGITYQLGLPLRFIGSGEKIPDLDVFVPERIVGRLMGAGDIVSLAEKTASVLNPNEAKDLSKKLKKGQFTFNDFLNQIEKVKKLGSMSSLISMIPGLGNMANALKDTDLESSLEVKKIKAMVNSMTKKEQENPEILNGSRRKRIALGSGLEVSEINRIIKRFDQASKMAKRLTNKKGISDLMNLMSQAKNQTPPKMC
ncbi:signal recognition particle protein [Helicobacter pylori]|uniref:signal recognition particle protein n=1 Tax=Helicobacter pylori TaxID=210 RepID=UPI0009824C0E|nr:signal recognition particle protein [Helicobacter pylori]AQM66104.1 Signal recognition particle protein [Helicobacter pylori SS1]AQM72556.1 Signal recognition particle protein [Helicobacter pylori PMSS1]KAF0998557.1 signal recognition particle protein [Helicobacter pylori SS1]KAF0998917.1 signal recognition particle protein [Helicobacter pylori SS1_190]OWT34265.1 signal recognition particle [Helicobacter pylori PMSS1]